MYNAEATIDRALDSALSQSYPILEIIVVDDGSTDSCPALVERRCDPRIRLVRQQNQGAWAARNTALSCAQGDWIQFLDSDDLLSPDKVARQIETALDCADGTVVVGRLVHWRLRDGIVWTQLEPLPEIDVSMAPIDYLVSALGPNGPAATIQYGAWLFPRSVVDRAGPWRAGMEPNDDGEWLARVILASRGVAVEAIGEYKWRRVTSGSVSTRTFDPQYYLGMLRAMDSIAEQVLLETDEDRARSALANRYLEIAVSAYPRDRRVSAMCLQRVRRLGGTAWQPTLGGPLKNLIGRMLGWRVAQAAAYARRRIEAIR
ncbi:MAG: glycosyltransferase family 2 protein [Proteobacteria bacterium]|nr:MAG: glycosyltransferase family 2 protein [Pseudomonadota bacterium]